MFPLSNIKTDFNIWARDDRWKTILIINQINFVSSTKHYQLVTKSHHSKIFQFHGYFLFQHLGILPHYSIEKPFICVSTTLWTTQSRRFQKPYVPKNSVIHANMSFIIQDLHSFANGLILINWWTASFFSIFFP